MHHSIAQVLARRREELGLSQRELAERAGVSHTVVGRMESLEHMPAVETVQRIALALDLQLVLRFDRRRPGPDE